MGATTVPSQATASEDARWAIVLHQIREIADRHERQAQFALSMKASTDSVAWAEHVLENRRLELFAVALSELSHIKLKDKYIDGVDSYGAMPPPETMRSLMDSGLSAGQIMSWGWRSTPKRRSRSSIVGPFQRQQQLRPANALKLLEPFLGDPRFNETLRLIDIANGCSIQCSTCYADSPLPSSILSIAPLRELFRDPRFIRMLQPDSLRFGGNGDISDHRHALEIVELALEASESVSRLNPGMARHKVQLYTAYRRTREKTILSLLDMAQASPNLHLVISLPRNETPRVQDDFSSFRRKHADKFDAHGPLIGDVSSYADGLDSSELAMVGRLLEGTTGWSGDHSSLFTERGWGKLSLNSDGLYWGAYATGYESHTSRCFVSVTPDNASHITGLPWHPDFRITPPNWRGGKGIEPARWLRTIRRETRLAYDTLRPLNRVQRRHPTRSSAESARP